MNKGFTLIEIVMALGIFIFSFAGIIGLFFQGFDRHMAGTSRITESMVAENVFASLKEPEIAALKSLLSEVEAKIECGIEKAESFPGYYYFFTLEPLGTSGSSRIFVTIYVLKQKFYTRFRELYEAGFETLTSELKEEYNTLLFEFAEFYTIIEKEFKEP